LAGDLVFAEGAERSARDLAATAGAAVDDVLSMWRSLGIVVPDPDLVMFTERDADLTAFLCRRIRLAHTAVNC
jgi:hypothetical protein